MLEERLTKVEQQVEELTQDMKALRADVNELRAEVNELRAEVNELRAEVSELRTEVRELRTHMGVLHEEVLDRIAAIADPSPGLRREIKAGDDELREHMVPIEYVVRTHSQQIAWLMGQVN